MKTPKKTKKHGFDEGTAYKAPIRWSKHTTIIAKNKRIHIKHHLKMQQNHPIVEILLGLAFIH